MSKVSTVHDAMVTELSGLFINKQRIPNAYDIESNPFLSKDMWGLRVESASQVTLEHCTFSIDRTFTVTIMKKFSRTETKAERFDQISKELLEESKLVLNLFLNSEELQAYDDIEKIDLTNATGIQSLNGNDESYLYMEMSFNVLISEQYT